MSFLKENIHMLESEGWIVVKDDYPDCYNIYVTVEKNKTLKFSSIIDIHKQYGYIDMIEYISKIVKEREKSLSHVDIREKFEFLKKCGYEVEPSYDFNWIEIRLRTDRFGYQIKTEFQDSFRDDFVEQVILRFNVLMMNEKVEKFRR